MPLAGIEPAAHGLGNRCSILMSYRGNIVVSYQLSVYQIVIVVKI